MSIATAIQNAQQKVAAAYTAVSSKGGTLPQTQNLSNLPTAINSISSGGSSTKYNITIDDLLGDIDENGVYQEPTTQASIIFTGIKKFADEYCMMYEFAHHPDIRSVSFPDLEDANKRECLNGAFLGCSNLTSASFPKLTKISGSWGMQYMLASTPITSLNLGLVTSIGDNGLASVCSNCSNLTSINFDSLQTVYSQGMQYAFRYCKLTEASFPSLVNIYSQGFYVTFSDNVNLSSVSLPVLKKIAYRGLQSAFTNTALTSMTFPSLDTITDRECLYYSFMSCNSLTSVSFPALKSTSFGSYTNQFSNMLYNVTGCTVHFPSNLQSVIGSWADVTAGFGGTNTTVSFDLTATE